MQNDAFQIHQLSLSVFFYLKLTLRGHPRPVFLSIACSLIHGAGVCDKRWPGGRAELTQHDRISGVIRRLFRIEQANWLTSFYVPLILFHCIESLGTIKATVKLLILRFLSTPFFFLTFKEKYISVIIMIIFYHFKLWICIYRLFLFCSVIYKIQRGGYRNDS